MRKALKIALIILASLLLIVITASIYVVLANLHMEHRGQDIEESYKYVRTEYPWINNWLDSMQVSGALRDTLLEFEREGEAVKVHALLASAKEPTNKTAVIVHGYTDCAVRMLMIGQMYHEDFGYNILLPDLMHSGESEGDAIGMGWLDRLDIKRWCAVANATFGDSTQQVIHGISMGAATTMMTSGESDLAGYVKCFVEDCGYTSVWDEFSQEIQNVYGLPPFPLLYSADAACKVMDGWCFHEASAIEAVSRCDRPIFFIHGGADTYVPTEMVYRLYEAKKSGDKEIWVADGSAHAMSYHDHKAEYSERVKAFTDKYIK